RAFASATGCKPPGGHRDNPSDWRYNPEEHPPIGRGAALSAVTACGSSATIRRVSDQCFPYLGIAATKGSLLTLRVSFDPELNSSIACPHCRWPSEFESTTIKIRTRLFAPFSWALQSGNFTFKVPENSQFARFADWQCWCQRTTTSKASMSASHERPGAELAMISADDADFGDNGRLVVQPPGARLTTNVIASTTNAVSMPFCDVSLFHLNPSSGLLVLRAIATANSRFADSRVCQIKQTDGWLAKLGLGGVPATTAVISTTPHPRRLSTAPTGAMGGRGFISMPVPPPQALLNSPPRDCSIFANRHSSVKQSGYYQRPRYQQNQMHRRNSEDSDVASRDAAAVRRRGCRCLRHRLGNWRQFKNQLSSEAAWAD
uniref:PepX_C domain-containing protein n=1 Tax=Macrostomum lignano TaxID=282301 RepID=A0A1I8FFQ7_9PLAT